MLGTKKHNDYYDLTDIKKKNCLYNIIISGRSNGKTFAVHQEMIERYFEDGTEGVIIRRYDDDLIGARGSQTFKNQVSCGNVDRLSNGLWTDIVYYSHAWYFCKYDDKGNRIRDIKPFCYGLSLSTSYHDKGSAYPNVGTICFDEFISKGTYLADEFILFMNTLSTIIRDRGNDGIKIYMLGNTINKYCPYFNEMGLKHIKDMKAGTIDIYTYGSSHLKVAVEYAINKVGKYSADYFAFDNPKLSMITGQEWELDIYPHCPIKYRPMDVKLTYIIKFDGDILQADIIMRDSNNFTYIHKKTTPIKDENKDIIFEDRYDPRRNHYVSIIKPVDNLTKRIIWYYISNNVYYQDNETGEIVTNYIKWCKNL